VKTPLNPGSLDNFSGISLESAALLQRKRAHLEMDLPCGRPTVFPKLAAHHWRAIQAPDSSPHVW